MFFMFFLFFSHARLTILLDVGLPGQLKTVIRSCAGERWNWFSAKTLSVQSSQRQGKHFRVSKHLLQHSTFCHLLDGTPFRSILIKCAAKQFLLRFYAMNHHTGPTELSMVVNSGMEKLYLVKIGTSNE